MFPYLADIIIPGNFPLVVFRFPFLTSLVGGDTLSRNVGDCTGNPSPSFRAAEGAFQFLYAPDDPLTVFFGLKELGGYLPLIKVHIHFNPGHNLAVAEDHLQHGLDSLLQLPLHPALNFILARCQAKAGFPPQILGENLSPRIDHRYPFRLKPFYAVGNQMNYSLDLSRLQFAAGLQQDGRRGLFLLRKIEAGLGNADLDPGIFDPGHGGNGAGQFALEGTAVLNPPFKFGDAQPGLIEDAKINIAPPGQSLHSKAVPHLIDLGLRDQDAGTIGGQLVRYVYFFQAARYLPGIFRCQVGKEYFIPGLGYLHQGQHQHQTSHQGKGQLNL